MKLARTPHARASLCRRVTRGSGSRLACLFSRDGELHPSDSSGKDPIPPGELIRSEDALTGYRISFPAS